LIYDLQVLFLSLGYGRRTSFFAIDIEPLGIQIVVVFDFCNFGGLVVIERVRIFVPSGGGKSDDGTLFFVFEALHIIILSFTF